jgi:hypothetical protein
LNPSQPGVSGFFTRGSYPLEEPLAERVLIKNISADHISKFQQLGYEVQVIGTHPKSSISRWHSGQ